LPRKFFDTSKAKTLTPALSRITRRGGNNNSGPLVFPEIPCYHPRP